MTVQNIETETTTENAVHYLDTICLQSNGGVRKRAPGGLPGRRPDWDNPFLADVLPPEVVQAIEGCAHDWETLTNADTGERKTRVNDFCHEHLFCGVCSTSQAHRNAARWREHFRAAGDALGLGVSALTFVFTVPDVLSADIAKREDRRDIVNALFRGVHNTFKAADLAGWVATVHFVASKTPNKPHVHFHALALPVTSSGRQVAGFVDREQFAERRRRFLGLWNRELARVCDRFSLGNHRAENIHLGVLKIDRALAKMLHYETRPVMQDPFIHGKGSLEMTKDAVDLTLSFLYPPGSKTAFRRIRGGGCFSPRAMKAFFDELGLERQDTEPEDDGQWVSEGPSRLLGVNKYTRKATFLILRTGEVVDIPLHNVSMSSHGAGFEWVRKG